MATLTWLIVPCQIGDPGKLKAMKTFLHWVYGPGQKVALSTDYSVIQPPLLTRISDQVADIH
jgi:hypothetical protein